jgi:hypothetical protein
MQDNLSPFFASFTETLKSNGTVVHVDAAGSYFYCKEATGRFQMRFDQGRWFEFDQSFYFRLEEPFGAVEFKALDGGTQDITILFYVCSREIGAHLNIIREPANFQSFQYVLARTLAKGYSADTIAASTALTFYGKGGAGVGEAGAAYAFRKAFIISNNDSGSLLEIWDGTNTVRLGSVQPLKAWMMETSDDLVVRNETLSPINFRVCELFYMAL